jgi:hypothetical protein
MKNRITFTLMAFLLTVVNIASGQRSISEDRLNQARVLLNDYREASYFRNAATGNYDPMWEDVFRGVFNTQRIIFDVPLRNLQAEQTETQKTGNLPDNHHIIDLFQKRVTIDEYIEAIRTAYHLHDINNFAFTFTEISFDTTGITTGRPMQFLVRKTFDHANWSVANATNYIVEVGFFGGQPQITAILRSDDEPGSTDVVLTFVNSGLSRNDPDHQMRDIVAHLRLEFDEAVFNSRLIAGADNAGRISMGLISNRAVLKVDTAINLQGQKFSVPAEWRVAGKLVNTQPPGGFVVPLRPWQWNGFSWSVKGFGGMIGSGDIKSDGFSGESSFGIKNGYKYGFGLEVAKHYSIEQVLKFFGNRYATSDAGKIMARRNSYVGIGAGLSWYQFQYNITSSGFSQQRYDYLDRLGTPVSILVMGSSFEETVSSNGVMLPLFAEFRRTIQRSQSRFHGYAIQAGMNLIIPFETSYEFSGEFSRHGFYTQFNPQPVTNDAFYNYYTGSTRSISDKLKVNPLSPAFMLRVNGYLDVSGGRSDNLLDIGVMVMLPSGTSGSGATNVFQFATGNDEFNSMSQARDKVYDFFIGLSVGYNFIKYRVN